MPTSHRAHAWAVGILLSTLTGCVVAPAAPPQPPAHPAIAAAQAHIHSAAAILRDRAAGDFAGHKAAALRWLVLAEQQLQEAKVYADHR